MLKTSFDFHAYPDANYNMFYSYKKVNDPVCTSSKAEFEHTVADCPVGWYSKLQTKMTESMMEADFIATATCCEYLPIMDIVNKLGKAVRLSNGNKSHMYVTIHEENFGTLVSAETLLPTYTTLSTHYAIILTWF